MELRNYILVPLCALICIVCCVSYYPFILYIHILGHDLYLMSDTNEIFHSSFFISFFLLLLFFLFIFPLKGGEALYF